MLQFKKVLTLTLVLSVILMEYAGAQNSFYLAADAGFSSIKEGIYSEKEFQTNFGIQLLASNNIMVEVGLGFSKSNIDYDYPQFTPSGSMDYTSYYAFHWRDQKESSYLPFVSIGYLKRLTKKIQIGAKLKAMYEIGSLKFEPTYFENSNFNFADLNISIVSLDSSESYYPNLYNGPNLNNGVIENTGTSNYSRKVFKSNLSPFVRFFIWERFGVDLTLGGLIYNKELSNELPNYPDSNQREEEFKISLKPSNWTLGLFWKMNK